MKNIGGIVLVLIVLAGGFFALNSYIYTEKQAEDAQYTELVDTETGLSLNYRVEPEGYVLLTLEKDANTDPVFVRQYTLMFKTDYEWLQQNTEATEGPPSIGIAIYRNTQNQSASMWVDARPELSNMGLLTGEVDRDAVVGGANAVRYMVDGLYRNDTAVVAHGGYIVMFSGAFLEEDSHIRRDFIDLLDSVEFTESALTAHTWVWEGTVMNNDSIVTPNEKDAFTIRFTSDGRVSGTTDCNSFFGDAVIGSDQSISFGPLGATKKFCRGSQESDFMGALSKVGGYVFDANGNLVLLLKYDSGLVHFKKQ